MLSRKDSQDDPRRGGEGEMGENVIGFYGNPMCSLNLEQFTCLRLLASIWERPISGHRCAQN